MEYILFDSYTTLKAHELDINFQCLYCIFLLHSSNAWIDQKNSLKFIKGLNSLEV